jgi:hypothetical protein
MSPAEFAVRFQLTTDSHRARLEAVEGALFFAGQRQLIRAREDLVPQVA